MKLCKFVQIHSNFGVICKIRLKREQNNFVSRKMCFHRTPNARWSNDLYPTSFRGYCWDKQCANLPRQITDNRVTYIYTVYSLKALILVGNSEICAHVRNNLCYLICLGHLIRSRADTNQIFFSEKAYFPSCVRSIIWIAI